MRTIDIESWPRREHFETFGAFALPYFDMCADMDLTRFRPAVKERGVSFNTAVVYVLTKAANGIAAFRQRIRGTTVVEHAIVHPASTIMADGGLFTFCFFEYREDFSRFVRHADARVAEVKAHPSLADPPGRDDVLFMTAIPWVSFTSFGHPMPGEPGDAIPRIAWGKYHEVGSALKMPLEVQGHHALMDGLHMGRYYEAVQGYLDEPESYLS